MKTTKLFFMIGIGLLVSSTIFAGGRSETAGGDFAERLETALESADFTVEEAEAVRSAIENREFGELEAADAQLVARALVLAREEQNDLDPDENAELALELARNTLQLRQENYDSTEVARATMDAVRAMHQDIERWQSGEMEEPLGEMIRNQVRNQVREVARKQGQEKAAEKAAEKEAGSGNRPAAAGEPGGSSRPESGENGGAQSVGNGGAAGANSQGAASRE